jgi:hypothetical protein
MEKSIPVKDGVHQTVGIVEIGMVYDARRQRLPV